MMQTVVIRIPTASTKSAIGYAVTCYAVPALNSRSIPVYKKNDALAAQRPSMLQQQNSRELLPILDMRNTVMLSTAADVAYTDKKSSCEQFLITFCDFCEGDYD